MKVKVDGDLCSGHARCWTLSRKFFGLDTDGYNMYRGTTIDVPPEFHDAVLRAEQKCPERAISTFED